jgi:hypothetical protein
MGTSQASASRRACQACGAGVHINTVRCGTSMPPLSVDDRVRHGVHPSPSPGRHAHVLQLHMLVSATATTWQDRVAW